MNNAIILIVEDDNDIRHANQAALTLEGFRVFEANTLQEGRSFVRNCMPDLIVLDVLLSDGNGLAYCEELRGTSDVRILLLSEQKTKENVLAGLRAGGDDYLAKPYDMDELILRVKALMRRGIRGIISHGEAPQVLGKLTLNHTALRALLGERDMMLKPKEFALLSILANTPNRFVPASELYHRVWGQESLGDIRTVKEHISRIRSKLGEASGISIVSKRGKGYHIQL